jgi:diguanylate cyclase (GGDEF)-like protein
MDRETIEEKLESIDNLPTFTGIAMRILEAVKREETSLLELGDLLSKDPVLSAKVLKMVNSPVYALPFKIASVPHGVSILGLNAVKNLALSFCLLRDFQETDANDFSYTRFWKNSLIGAISSKIMAQGIIPALAEDAFFLGLLHDVGILAVNEAMPKQYCLVVREMQKTGCRNHEAENQILGFNHMEIGQHLMKKWGLPERLYEPIGHHHDPRAFTGECTEISTLTRILHLASLYIDFLDRPEKSFLFGLINYFIEEYGFSHALKVDEIADKVHKRTGEIFPLFEIKLEEEKNYYRIIEEAREQLLTLSEDSITMLVQQRSQIEELREQVVRDGLTELYNYQRIREQLEKEISRAVRYKHPLSVAFVDIDGFKEINDTYGHVAGDYVLKSLANHLTLALRESDVLSRYGGDEFAIIMPETKAADAKKAAERLRRSIESLEFFYEGKRILCTISLGIASMLPDEDVTMKKLLKMADNALYHAKNAGKNRSCLFDDIRIVEDSNGAQMDKTSQEVRRSEASS